MLWHVLPFPLSRPINTSWSITFDVHDQTNYYDLRGLPCMKSNEEVYILTLFAQNIIGESNGSSPSEYKASKSKLQ